MNLDEIRKAALRCQAYPHNLEYRHHLGEMICAAEKAQRSMTLLQEIDRIVERWGVVITLDAIGQNALNHSTRLQQTQTNLANNEFVQALVTQALKTALIARTAGDAVDHNAALLALKYPKLFKKMGREINP